MTERELSRREALAAIGAAVTAVVGVALAFLSSDEEEPTPGTATETATRTPSVGSGTDRAPDVEDIREYGAAVDGTTDDTEAIMRAVRAASPGGTVRMPAGTIRVSGIDTGGEAIRLNAANADITIRGADPGTGETKLVLAGGHQTVHSAIYIATAQDESVGTITLERLTIEGNKANQGTNPGLGIRTEAEGTFVLRDCRVTGWQNTGVQLSGGMDAEISYCYFGNNGLNSNGGHDISPNQARHPAETVISHVLCTNSGGVSIDVGQNHDARLQTVLIDRCVLRNSLGSLKLSTENKLTTVRHTRMLGDDSTTIPVKVNPTNVSVDDLVLDNVLIDGGGWPGIDLPCPGRVTLNEVALKNVDQDNLSRGRNRGGIFTRQIDFGSSGRISVHNVGQGNNGPALNVEEAAGRIGEVIYGDVGGVGTTDGLEVGTATRGDPLQPDVVSVDDVGPRSTAS